MKESRFLSEQRIGHAECRGTSEKGNGHLELAIFDLLEDLESPRTGGVDSPHFGLAGGPLVETLHLGIGEDDICTLLLVNHSVKRKGGRTLEVGDDTLGSDRLGEADTSSLDLPSDQDVGSVDRVSLGDSLDDGVLELRSTSGSEGRVRLEEYAVRLGPREEFGLSAPQVELDLVDGRLDPRVLHQLLRASDREVGDSNLPDLARVDEGLHRTPSGEVVESESNVEVGLAVGRLALCESDGPVHEVEVEVGDSEVLQLLVESSFDTLGCMRAVPEL